VSRLPLRLFAPALALGAALPALAAAPAATGPVVELPPFLVAEAGIPLQWRYAAFDHFEVLSVCSDEATTAFMGQVDRLYQELDYVLPPEFQLRQSEPVTYVLCGDTMQQRLDRDIPAQMLARPAASPSAPPMANLRASFHALPNMRLRDQDAYTVFALVNEQQIETTKLALTPEHVQALLEGRVPQLPPWFVSGFMRLYGSILLPTKPAPSQGMSILHQDGAYDPARIDLAPFVWISDEEAAGLRAHPRAPSPLLPLEDLLGAPRPPADPAEADHYHQAWVSQAALFIRWGLDARTPAMRQAFWKWVGLAAAGSVTEAMFRDNFGLSYAQMRDELGHYLATDALSEFEPSQGAPSPPSIRLRDATDLDIARLKGDWERLETSYVKQAYPALSDQYRDLEQRTLRRAYDRGARDPRLLAVLGLCECDAGDDAAALPLLTAAVRTGGVRPRADFELARIRFAQASAAPAGPAGGFSAAQVASVLEPLALARTQSPPLIAAYALLADVWFHSAVPPTPADLAPLEEGVRLFPRASALALDEALFEARAGRWAEANATIDRSLRNATNDPDRDRLIQLQLLLAKSPPPAR